MKPDGLAPDSRRAGRATSDADACEVCPLDAMRCGDAARVVRLSGAPRTMRRLLALGLRPSAPCQLLGRSPAGGPLHLRAGSVHLMLRADEAAEVYVRPEPAPEADDVVRTL